MSTDLAGLGRSKSPKFHEHTPLFGQIQQQSPQVYNNATIANDTQPQTLHAKHSLRIHVIHARMMMICHATTHTHIEIRIRESCKGVLARP